MEVCPTLFLHILIPFIASLSFFAFLVASFACSAQIGGRKVRAIHGIGRYIRRVRWSWVKRPGPFLLARIRDISLCKEENRLRSLKIRRPTTTHVHFCCHLPREFVFLMADPSPARFERRGLGSKPVCDITKGSVFFLWFPLRPTLMRSARTPAAACPQTFCETYMGDI